MGSMDGRPAAWVRICHMGSMGVRRVMSREQVLTRVLKRVLSFKAHDVVAGRTGSLVGPRWMWRGPMSSPTSPSRGSTRQRCR